MNVTSRSPEASIFSEYKPESPIATELRRLYNNLKRKSERSQYKTFLMTSAVRGEGKSTIASYLAVTVAQFPQIKALIVDADMRRPRMHSVFGVENLGGLKECLAHSADPLSVIKKTHLNNLDVITAGGKTDSPSKLFESESLADFFAKVRFYYDIVVVDSAPVLAVSDTLFLSAELDAVVLVVLAGVTPNQVVIRAKETLVDAHANIVGAVVNNMSAALPYYYDYKYYGAYRKT